MSDLIKTPTKYKATTDCAPPPGTKVNGITHPDLPTRTKSSNQESEVTYDRATPSK